MRDMTNAMQTEIIGAVIRPVVLAKLEFDSGDVTIWTGTRPIVFGGDTYVGGGDLTSVGVISETLELKASGLEVALSGISSSLLSIALAETYQYRVATFRLAAIDVTGAIVADPVVFMSGYMDTMEIDEGPATSTIKLTIENALATMQMPSERLYTDEEQQIDYPGDLAFEYVSRLNDGQEVQWG